MTLNTPSWLSKANEEALRQAQASPEEAANDYNGTIVRLSSGHIQGPQDGEIYTLRYTDSQFIVKQTTILGVNTYYEGPNLQEAVNALARAIERSTFHDPEDFS